MSSRKDAVFASWYRGKESCGNTAAQRAAKRSARVIISLCPTPQKAFTNSRQVTAFRLCSAFRQPTTARTCYNYKNVITCGVVTNGGVQMTETMKAELEALVRLADKKVDSEARMPSSSLYKPRKEQITARLDADVLEWLKSQGKGYQTLMNRLLRTQMLEDLQKRKG